jgi:transcriptional regulator with XRE-family HTH domain
MTQDQFAKKLGVTDAHISYLERGERGPSLGMLHRMARLLKTTVGRLVPDKV